VPGGDTLGRDARASQKRGMGFPDALRPSEGGSASARTEGGLSSRIYRKNRPVGDSSRMGVGHSNLHVREVLGDLALGDSGHGRWNGPDP
jgi:hypothetical protein